MLSPGYVQALAAIVIFSSFALFPSNPALLPDRGQELGNTTETEGLWPRETQPVSTEETVAPDPDAATLSPPPAKAEPESPKLPQLVYSGKACNMVALTFDDGPYPKKTEQYLDVLAQYGLEATFFVVGDRAELYAAELQKIVEQGSELGSHSWAHDSLDKMKKELLSGDLERVRGVIQEITGEEVKYLRPPYGRHSRELLSTAADLKYQLVLWNVDPRDWEQPTPETIVSRTMEQVRPGSIIILHEGYQNTLEALPMLIEALQERGLKPVPVSELLEGEKCQV
jgi:peptidoglycan/xylan/chitin deacetylase (PgdA/CDA1 family)